MVLDMYVDIDMDVDMGVVIGVWIRTLSCILKPLSMLASDHDLARGGFLMVLICIWI